LIDLDSFIEFMKKFNYICNNEDRNELRVFFFNNNVFVNGPKYYNSDTLFIDLERFIEILRILSYNNYL
jgi:hypothetical protein